MKTRKRLTRQESKEVTRLRLIEAAEKVFIRKGFDYASVDEISETAGYSRGAFYSNFRDKDQVFLAVIDRRQPQVVRMLDETLGQASKPGERNGAVREWFSKQWRLKEFIALQMEFSRVAMRNRSFRAHFTELRREQLDTYATSVRRYAAAMNSVPVDRPEVVALVLLAVAYGLGSLSIDAAPEWEQLYKEAARIAFDRMTAPESRSSDHLGTGKPSVSDWEQPRT